MNIARSKQNVLRYGPAAVMTAVISALSLAPAHFFHGVESALPHISGLDKMVHALMYAALTASYLHAVPQPRRRSLKAVLWIVLGAAIYGIVMELCQKWLTTTRCMDPRDALANAVGALTYALFACAWARPQADRTKTLAQDLPDSDT